VAVTGGDRTGKSTVVGVFPTSCFPPFDAAIPLAAQDRTLPQLPARPPSGSQFDSVTRSMTAQRVPAD
jgi:hypothetical protein